jgi:gliding motility-associated-like protein
MGTKSRDFAQHPRIGQDFVLEKTSGSGKLIKQIDSKTEGWNGIFNGQKMPASDYWYSATLEDGRVMTGHFTLKR